MTGTTRPSVGVGVGVNLLLVPSMHVGNLPYNMYS